MRIAIVCSSRAHPIWPDLQSWREQRSHEHEVVLVERLASLPAEGDILFLISCVEIVSADVRRRFDRVLVIHASNLPEGRGWSPLVWQVIEGRSEIAVSLLEAADPVDSGPIWAKRWIKIADHELYDEINRNLFDAELELMDYAVNEIRCIVPAPQGNKPPTYYRKRTPDDSRVDPDRPIVDQFDLLRVCDPERYPAFFTLRGYRYTIQLKKVGKEE